MVLHQASHTPEWPLWTYDSISCHSFPRCPSLRVYQTPQAHSARRISTFARLSLSAYLFNPGCRKGEVSRVISGWELQTPGSLGLSSNHGLRKQAPEVSLMGAADSKRRAESTTALALSKTSTVPVYRALHTFQNTFPFHRLCVLSRCKEQAGVSLTQSSPDVQIPPGIQFLQQHFGSWKAEGTEGKYSLGTIREAEEILYGQPEICIFLLGCSKIWVQPKICVMF